MANLNVSSALLDPYFATRVTVNRRAEAIDPNSGLSVITSTPNKNVPCVITSAGPNDLERLDDNQRMGRNLVVVTKFRLRGPSPGFQPDTITFNGDTYVVKTVDPYSQYGQGFIQAIVGSMDLVDQSAS